MTKKIAVVTVLFDYPSHFVPTFQNKILNDLDSDDYYVIRYNSEEHNISQESYYFKFTYFRIKEIVLFIKEKMLNKYEYFILLDATDVGYINNLISIETIMKEYECDILFGAERNLWPNTDYSHLHDEKNIKTPYKFLNAGVFCAKPQSFLSHIEKILERGLVGLCDQGNWQIEYLLNDNIQLDYNNKLVLNTYLAKQDFTLINGGVKFLINQPIFIHDNGGYNDDTVKLLDYFI
jgi:hypothetical protein